MTSVRGSPAEGLDQLVWPQKAMPGDQRGLTTAVNGPADHPAAIEFEALHLAETQA
jgi:hypothetical protein